MERTGETVVVPAGSDTGARAGDELAMEVGIVVGPTVVAAGDILTVNIRMPASSAADAVDLRLFGISGAPVGKPVNLPVNETATIQLATDELATGVYIMTAEAVGFTARQLFSVIR